MGGHMQQSNDAALYDHPGGDNAGPSTDAGDAVMARWLQSAGLQHLGSNNNDNRGIPNLLMQGYGAQSAEEKQRLYKLMRGLNFGGHAGSEPYISIAQGSGAMGAPDNFLSSEFRGDFGAGLLDLHAMDDTELLSEHAIPEPFQPSSVMPSMAAFEDDFNVLSSRQEREQTDMDTSVGLLSEKENSRENNVAKIKVVVRKRPLNKKELARKEDDVVTVYENDNLAVHEPKLKVDLTAYVEKHEFCFDSVLDEDVSNDEVYRQTVEPIIPAIFQRVKATCFAYGQTGSGKTFTMRPLPLRAAEDLIRLLHHPTYRNQRFKLWLSFFEIYGGKLFDLLSDRKKLLMREDGRQQVCIVGLQEFEVSDVQVVKEFIEKGNSTRSTGSTGANEESSRSHAILQLVVKKHVEVKDTRRNYNYNNNDVNEAKNGKVVGKISFIDLAGSERGADTTDNDRQTRIEGAEINKSLLALKECIRALDNDQIHIPFRGSKLTEVLRDSFVGNSRTVMISCISPGAGSCEHTLNTLRYADRVKSLSKSGNPKKDQASSTVIPAYKEPIPVPAEVEDFQEPYEEAKVVDTGKKVLEKENHLYKVSESHKQPSSFPASYVNGRDDSGTFGFTERNRLDKQNIGNLASQKNYSSPHLSTLHDSEERVPKVSPPRRKALKEEKTDKAINWMRKEDSGPDLSTNYKQQCFSNSSTNQMNSNQYEPEPRIPDGKMNEILEEEEALIGAHRKEIEDTMEMVREEMKLLAEVDQPGSHIDNYVAQLSFVLSRKAASLVSLQARLARFQHRLKEQEILSRKRVPR